jgi:hypothetical protein
VDSTTIYIVGSLWINLNPCDQLFSDGIDLLTLLIELACGKRYFNGFFSSFMKKTEALSLARCLQFKKRPETFSLVEVPW